VEITTLNTLDFLHKSVILVFKTFALEIEAISTDDKSFTVRVRPVVELCLWVTIW
jgi:hypothetical protein